jgi:enamine deaminase RidA (YjgF/YER057c/UK114 family)
MTPVFLPGLFDPAAAATVRRYGHSAEAASQQAEAVFARLHDAMHAAGGSVTDVCKITMQITDRAYREPIYRVLGRQLAGVFPVSTGLIVKGLPEPCALFQLDSWAISGGPHARLRRYRSTDAPYGLTRQKFVCDFCMAVVAGRRIFLRGQTGLALDGVMVGLNNPASQARQAIENVRVLLAEAGADLSHVVKLVTYATDRAFLAPVREVLATAFAGAPVAGTELVVKGLAAPELLMEIDVHATLPP